MICNRTEAGWELIYQNAHGLLAAALLAPWKRAERPDRWIELLNATAQHDNGWQEWEAGYHLTDLGTPRHFEETPVVDLVRQSERVVQRAWHQSVWGGLLVAQHVSHLYAGRDEPELKALLREMAALRRKGRHALGVKQEEVAHAYEWLLWGDTFSLVLACGQLPFGERRIEISSVQGQRYETWQRQDGSLGVHPWPYEVDRFEVAVDTYRLRQLTFRSDEALAEALRAARPVRKSWTLRREG